MKPNFLIIAISVFCAQLAFAQDAKKVEAPAFPEPKIKTGVIANSGLRTGHSEAVNVNTSDDVPGDKVFAITGGVTNNAGKCNATLSNASPLKTYRVRFEVSGKDARGNSIFKKNFSGQVPPGGKLVKDFTCAKEAQLVLDLKFVEPVK